MLGYSQVPAQLTASQEGLSSMSECVSESEISVTVSPAVMASYTDECNRVRTFPSRPHISNYGFPINRKVPTSSARAGTVYRPCSHILPLRNHVWNPSSGTEGRGAHINWASDCKSFGTADTNREVSHSDIRQSFHHFQGLPWSWFSFALYFRLHFGSIPWSYTTSSLEGIFWWSYVVKMDWL
jgi:hypothetical protein